MRKSGFFPRLALVNLMRNGRFYGPYLLSCGMTAAMYYILSYLTFSDIVASVRGAGYLQSLMYLGRLVVTLFSAVLLLYANSFVMKRRRRELGLYNILGLEKRHTARLMVWETLYCAAAAIVGGLAAGVLLSKLVLLLLLQLSHLPVEYGFEISLSGMADTAALFGFLFLLTLDLFGTLALHELNMQRPDFRQKQKFPIARHDSFHFLQLIFQLLFFLMILFPVGRVFRFKPRLFPA